MKKTISETLEYLQVKHAMIVWIYFYIVQSGLDYMHDDRW